MVAAIMGSTAFFAPITLTLPFNGPFGLTIYLDIYTPKIIPASIPCYCLSQVLSLLAAVSSLAFFIEFLSGYRFFIELNEFTRTLIAEIRLC